MELGRFGEKKEAGNDGYLSESGRATTLK